MQLAAIAVIDFETTGYSAFQHDRVVEIGVVLMSPEGEILGERCSLINPNRDVGPTFVHGITATHLIHAPTFSDAIGHFNDLLAQAGTFAAHNCSFDMQFLEAEFRRMGVPVPSVPVVCTMQMSGGGNLDECCKRFGVEFEGTRHSALGDARAAALILAAILRAQPGLASELRARAPCGWPQVPPGPTGLLTRREAAMQLEKGPQYLDALAGKVEQFSGGPVDPTGVLEYADALSKALRDRFIHEAEGASLIELAVRWRLSLDALRAIHEHGFRKLVAAASQDHVIGNSERSDLMEVARLLGIDLSDARFSLPESKPAASARTEANRQSLSSTKLPPGRGAHPVTMGTLIDSEYSGSVVCFTGTSQCSIGGQQITKDLARELAEQRGITVMESFTKKVTYLIVADPNSQSGKARKAREYGVPVIHERAFWSAIGVSTD